MVDAHQLPAIVDEATWQAAQVQLARNKALSFRHMKPGRIYLLRPHWFRCRRCRMGMAALWQHGRVYYRCSSHHEPMDRAARYRGTVRGEDEGRVWNAVMRLLENPELVGAKRRSSTKWYKRPRLRSTRNWRRPPRASSAANMTTDALVDAYIAGAFTAQELKAYRAEVATRGHGLEARRQELLAKQAGLWQTAGQAEALTAYWARVRERLRTFTVAEKQLVFDALALTIFWTPGEPLHLEATIPLDGDGIVSSPSRWKRKPSLPSSF